VQGAGAVPLDHEARRAVPGGRTRTGRFRRLVEVALLAIGAERLLRRGLLRRGLLRGFLRGFTFAGFFAGFFAGCFAIGPPSRDFVNCVPGSLGCNTAPDRRCRSLVPCAARSKTFSRRVRCCSPTARREPTTSGWASSQGSRRSSGTSTIPNGCASLHQAFVDAGADIILTNTFGGNRHRLKLHPQRAPRARAQPGRGPDRAGGRRRRAPTGRGGGIGRPDRRALRAPSARSLKRTRSPSSPSRSAAWSRAGSTLCGSRRCRRRKSSARAARAAIAVGVPYTATASFDTAGRTMMGLHPADYAAVFRRLRSAPDRGRRELRRGRVRHPCDAPRDERRPARAAADLEGQLRGAVLPGRRHRVLRRSGSHGRVRAPRRRRRRSRSSAGAAAPHLTTSARCAPRSTRTSAAPHPRPSRSSRAIGPLANSAPETTAASSARGRERRRARN